MQVPDLINGLVECVGGFFTWKNALAIYRDKSIKGVYWPSTVFFTCWGLWNLYFYPILHQWLSFIGGIFLVAGNICWVILAMYYLFFKKPIIEFSEKDLALSIDEFDVKYIKPACEQILKEKLIDEKFYAGEAWEGYKRRKRTSKATKKGKTRTAKAKKKITSYENQYMSRWLRTN
jgi:hypothetical protein